MSKRPRLRIVATRLETVMESLEHPRGVRLSRVELDQAPVANVDELQAIVGGWWLQSGGYAVGQESGTRIG